MQHIGKTGKLGQLTGQTYKLGQHICKAGKLGQLTAKVGQFTGKTG